MCETIDHRRQVGKNILIEFERDPSLRATEVLVINQDRNGRECQGVKITCYDNGKMVVSRVNDIIEGVDIVI